MEKEVNVGKIAIWLVVILLAMFLVVKFSDVSGRAVQQETTKTTFYYDNQILFEKDKLASNEKDRYNKEIALEKEKLVSLEKERYEKLLEEEKIRSQVKPIISREDIIKMFTNQKVINVKFEEIIRGPNTCRDVYNLKLVVIFVYIHLQKLK